MWLAPTSSESSLGDWRRGQGWWGLKAGRFCAASEGTQPTVAVVVIVLVTVTPRPDTIPDQDTYTRFPVTRLGASTQGQVKRALQG
jgi:hypothetical protein